ncbi:putative cyclic phosphodiesterase-like protein [Lyophyllum shimeji]|uniref:Cyclic phosphodiesterase-like protein n=1 Tax=Lyophyllum shimeji TaxID=47721 RepID=A0A9P3PF14_LYOSH|nr:putative cyclic phosphodiesterase-like protein [Lyophyllum shimeji]
MLSNSSSPDNETLREQPQPHPSTMGIAVWLVPSAEDAQRLKRIMDTRREERSNHPSSYPSFHSHITLASLPLQSASPSEIRAAIPKFEHGLSVKFKSIEIGTHFFRSVYIAIELTPELSALHDKIHAKLAIEPRTPAFPHVSLCYIADEAAREREEFFRELKDGGKIRQIQNDSNVSINCAGGPGEEDWMSGFLAKEVWVAQCDGPVEDWTVLDKIPIA